MWPLLGWNQNLQPNQHFADKTRCPCFRVHHLDTSPKQCIVWFHECARIAWYNSFIISILYFIAKMPSYIYSNYITLQDLPNFTYYAYKHFCSVLFYFLLWNLSMHVWLVYLISVDWPKKWYLKMVTTSWKVSSEREKNGWKDPYKKVLNLTLYKDYNLNAIKYTFFLSI